VLLLSRPSGAAVSILLARRRRRENRTDAGRTARGTFASESQSRERTIAFEIGHRLTARTSGLRSVAPKLDIHSTAGLVRYAIRNKMINA
jgi:hypothetical protein